ncbi:MAG: flagellar biosynthetic protein FliO [Gammaproteobacteria bacterium]|nr:flagellar biosynthetic protein FliO [Gammaproteobacteria bacterium]MDP2140848.1 flagellar biosynthetic protein FliO [Gammaproteobacteria bacterium]MDP2349409.1 flagellar biosynthetic protein FliO [Gammaproteobacteria bacterium]
MMTAAATTTAGEQGAATLGIGAALEMLLWLGVVVGFILVCAWAFRRMSGGVLAAAGVIKVRSVISVGNRERVALLEVGDKQILVGMCPGQISTLHVFDEPVLPPLDGNEQRTSGAGDFAAKLQSLINKDGAR